MRVSGKVLFVLAFYLLDGSLAWADSATYLLTMSGDQEVPGPGDADGSASGFLTLNDVTGEVTWDFTFSDIASPTAMHIHGPGGSAGSSAGVAIGLGIATSGPAGTLIDSVSHPTSSDITAILSDPTDYYVNIHNADFGPGAVRGQLGIVPEPSCAVLLLFGLPVLLPQRRFAITRA